jgi:hypothetical protein
VRRSCAYGLGDRRIVDGGDDGCKQVLKPRQVAKQLIKGGKAYLYADDGVRRTPEQRTAAEAERKAAVREAVRAVHGVRQGRDAMLALFGGDADACKAETATLFETVLFVSGTWRSQH